MFLGWFGPRGLASILFGLLVLENKLPHGEEIFFITVFTVLLSVFAHGITAYPLSNWYGAKAEAMKDEEGMPELRDVSHMPLRFTSEEIRN